MDLVFTLSVMQHGCGLGWRREDILCMPFTEAVRFAEKLQDLLDKIAPKGG